MEPKVHQHIAFRPDVEGIRAVAVLLILLNHSGVRGFQGGFVGVDVFFVISGYLITAILLRDIRNGTNSIAGFYRRRILRILPALFVMLVAATVCAFRFMVPGELAIYGKSLLATFLFSSNFAFYADTGYFTLAAATRPLLHTWSLAIEEQFYIFWPLILTVAARRGAATFNGTLIVIAILSFAASIWAVGTDMSAAFYLLPFRAWELALGGLVSLMPQWHRLPRALRQALGTLGMLVILICANRYRELSTPFPGLSAAAPCLGTAALILAGPDTWAGRLLSLSVPRFFGRISYSLYLWHWPVIVFTRLALLPMEKPVVIMADIAISILLGWLSWLWIEQGGRKLLEALPNPRLFAVTAGTILLCGGGAASVVAARGFPDRFSTEARSIAAVFDDDEQKSYRAGRCFVVEPGNRFDADACLAMHPSKPSLLLVGDSTAAHYWPGFARQAGSLELLQATMVGCRPQISDRVKMPCQTFFNSILIDWLATHHPDAVALAGNWQESDLPVVEATLAKLKARHIRTILIGPMPRYDTSLARLLFFTAPAEREQVTARHLDPTVWPIGTALRQVAARQGAAYIAPTDLICPGARCQVFAAPAVPLQFDDVHLTHQGSGVVVSRMMPALLRTLFPAKDPA